MARRLEAMSGVDGRLASAQSETTKASEPMSWLLDADVLSQPAKARGNHAVIAWLDEQQDACYTSTVVIAQIAYWVRTKEGRTRSRLQQWLQRAVESLEG